MIVSSIPNDTVNTTIHTNFTDFRLDYLLHFIAYAFIGGMAAMAYEIKLRMVFLLLLFAAVEEGHQYWIPSRTFNPIDYLFDVLGLVAGLGIIFSIQSIFIKQHRAKKDV